MPLGTCLALQESLYNQLKFALLVQCDPLGHTLLCIASLLTVRVTKCLLQPLCIAGSGNLIEFPLQV